MAYTLQTTPTYPAIGDSVLVDLLNDSVAVTGARLYFTSVPTGSELATDELVKDRTFIPDVGGLYYYRLVDERTTYTAPRFSGDAFGGTRTRVYGSLDGYISIASRSTLDLNILGQSFGIEVLVHAESGVSKVRRAAIVNTDNGWGMNWSNKPAISAALSNFVGANVDAGGIVFGLVNATNTLVQKYNAHIIRTDSHYIVDGYFPVIAKVQCVQSAIDALNELRLNYPQHEESRLLHKADASTMRTIIPACYDKASAIVLCARLRELHNDHIASSTIHLAADSANTITINDKLTTLINAIVDELEADAIFANSDAVFGDVALIAAGFKKRNVDENTITIEKP